MMLFLLILVHVPFAYIFFRIFQFPVLGENCLDFHNNVLKGIQIATPWIPSTLHHFHSNQINETAAPNHIQVCLHNTSDWALFIAHKPHKSERNTIYVTKMWNWQYFLWHVCQDQCYILGLCRCSNCIDLWKKSVAL